MRGKGTQPVRLKILRVCLLLTAVSTLLALGCTLYLTLRQERQGLDKNLLNSAQVISQVPLVRQALDQGGPNLDLTKFLDSATALVSDIDVIVVADISGIQYYHPDSSYTGTPYAGADQARILDGELFFTSDDMGVGGAERCAYAAVLGEDGSLLGFVVVGIYIRSVSRIILHTVSQYLLTGAVVAALGVFLSFQLSSRIKKSLLGLEPDVFVNLFHQREEILQALEEGILAIDTGGNVMYMNQAAGQMLGVAPENALSRPLREVYPASTLERVARSGRAEYNISLESLRHVRILADRMPIRAEGRIVGAVAIFRNRTEVTRLAEDLTGVRHMVEAMRAYTHEFMNKLHVILGLLQIGEQPRAEAYIMEITSVQHQAVGLILERIEDPSAAALLVGKSSRCAELGIRLVLNEHSHLSRDETFLPSSAYVPILGNLIENAVDALNQTARGLKEITVSVQEEREGLLLCVEDTGPGMSPEVRRQMFQPGFSTKGQERGTGLALVQELVGAYGGEIRVESEQGVGTAIFISFHRAANQIGGEGPQLVSGRHR